MPIEMTIKLFQYSELSDKAKSKAAQWWSECNVDWYESVIEDATQAGVRLTSWDVYRRYCTVEFITSAGETAEYIKENHGKECASYIAATDYLAAMEEIPEPDESSTEYDTQCAIVENSKEDAFDAFVLELNAYYLKMLETEYEYQQSEEYLSETMEANEYTFLENGKRFG